VQVRFVYMPAEGHGSVWRVGNVRVIRAKTPGVF
jgi:hypothetical protein